MKWLSSIFAIDICAYAVMNNHYHIVLKIDANRAKQWSDREVAELWTKIFAAPHYIRHWLNSKTLSEDEIGIVEKKINTWRNRLYDLSWYMRCLNEAIARMANEEDSCTGRFWEGRFKSQALLDERALLTCMAYVDLNPVRAAIANTLDESDYTSIQQRIQQPNDESILPFSDQTKRPNRLPYSVVDYLELVSWAKLEILSEGKARISQEIPRVLLQFAIDSQFVIGYLSKRSKKHFRAIGPWSRLCAMAKSVGLKFLHGKDFSQQLCPEVR
jgi:REP element-mobilizing transposase RayT